MIIHKNYRNLNCYCFTRWNSGSDTVLFVLSLNEPQKGQKMPKKYKGKNKKNIGQGQKEHKVQKGQKTNKAKKGQKDKIRK